MILTDDKGRPIPEIDPPAPDASIDEKIAYLHATAARNDRIASLANVAFGRRFHRAVRP